MNPSKTNLNTQAHEPRGSIRPLKRHFVRMNKLFFPLVLLCAFTGRSRAQAQTDGLNTLLTEFDAYRTRGVQEKIFVNTDKPDYLAGEIIWFKIYCVDAATHEPLDLSKICYVDVLDKDDRFVLQAKIAEYEGTA